MKWTYTKEKFSHCIIYFFFLKGFHYLVKDWAFIVLRTCMNKDMIDGLHWLKQIFIIITLQYILYR